MSTVTLNGSRLEDAEASTGWSNLVGGGPAPASEPQLKYQGSNAVNRKVNSTSDRRGVEYAHSSTTDMTGASFPLWMVKVKVADAADVNTTYGVELQLGDSNASYYDYNISGSGANNDAYTAGYSSQGGLAEGYIITALNPNVSQWREGTTATPDLTIVDHFAVAAQFVAGGAKSENVACDAIDVGVGLDYNGTSFTFDDGPDTDQDNTSNRWGFANRNGSVVTLFGLHSLATTGATSGTDTTTVLFPDGYHGSGDAGFDVDLGNASTDIDFDGTYTGLGRIYGSDDTRPDLTVTGTTGAFSSAGTFVNFRNITLTSACTIDGATIECADLTQGAATIDNTVIQVDTASQVAMCDDFTPTDCDNVTFEQVGSGHAIELTATGTISFTSLFFNGFGADASNDAAIFNDSGGAVTIQVAGGGDTPTYRNGSGASTTIENAVTIELTGLIAGSQIYIENTSDTIVLFNENEATTTFSDTVDYTADKNLLIRVRNSTSPAPYYKPFETTGTLTSTGFSLIVNQELDE